MSMEVLLMSDVAELGSEGTVVNVADGYARNYLFPKKLGAPVTDGMRRKLVKLQKERETARTKDLESARQKAASLAAVSVTLTVKVSKEEKLYGAIHEANILDALKSQGIELAKGCIEMKEPIKELGVFDVKIKIHPEVDATIKVWVVQE
jgi:large subunit ribosomal protein L9